MKTALSTASQSDTRCRGMPFAQYFGRFVLAAGAWPSSAIPTLAECRSGRLACPWLVICSTTALKSKLDAVCTELAAYVAETPSRGRDREALEISYRSAKQGSNWWPANLGTPSSVGAQNDLRYAVFPRRLVINDGGHLEIYDTGNHRIFGVAQAQSADQTLTFNSQDGLVRVKDLPKVRHEE